MGKTLYEKVFDRHTVAELSPGRFQLQDVDRFGGLAVRPDFRFLPRAMCSHRRHERRVLVPADHQLRVIIVMADDCAGIGRVHERWAVRDVRFRQPLPAPDVVSPIGQTAGGDGIEKVTELARCADPR